MNSKKFSQSGPLGQASAPKTMAVVNEFFPHYRLPIMRELMKQGRAAGWNCRFVSARNAEAMKTVDPAFAGQTETERVLPWQFVKSFRLPGGLIWQTGQGQLARDPTLDCIVHLGNARLLSTWFLLHRAKACRKPVYLWTHGITRDVRDWRDRLRNRFYRLSDGLLLYGNRAKKLLQDRGFPAERLHVLYNALDYPAQKIYRQQVAELNRETVYEPFFRDTTKPVLIFVGRLMPAKKLSMLLTAAAQLKTQGMPINLLLIGDGPETQALIQQAASLDLGDRFACNRGIYDESKLAKLFYHADCCVSPGNVGLLAIHAMAYGTPVITHDQFNFQNPEFEAVREGTTGAFFTRSHAPSLTQCLRNWLQSGRPREHTRAACISMVEEHYTPQKLTGRILAAIDKSSTGG